MALDTTAFRDGVRAAVKNVWPETTRVLNVRQANRKWWQRLSQQLPYAVVEASSFPKSPNGPVTRDCREPVVRIWYVAAAEGLEDEVAAKLDALATAFFPANPLPLGRTMRIEETSTDDDLVPNQVFAEAQRKQIAGMVAVRCMVCG